MDGSGWDAHCLSTVWCTAAVVSSARASGKTSMRAHGVVTGLEHLRLLLICGMGCRAGRDRLGCQGLHVARCILIEAAICRGGHDARNAHVWKGAPIATEVGWPCHAVKVAGQQYALKPRQPLCTPFVCKKGGSPLTMTRMLGCLVGLQGAKQCVALMC